MQSKITETITENAKILSKNTGISITNLLFLIEIYFLFFSKNFELSKLIIIQNKYVEANTQLYKSLYGLSTLGILVGVLSVSLLLVLPFPLPESLQEDFGVHDGFTNNTSQGFTLAAAFQKCLTIFIYYGHNLWVYLTAIYIVTGRYVSFTNLISLTKANIMFFIFNVLFLVGSLFYINVPTYYYHKNIDISDYIVLNSTNEYALLKNLSYEHPLFFLVKLDLKKTNKGVVEVCSSGFAEVKYAFENSKNRTIKPRPTGPGSVPKIDPSELNKLSMTKK